VKLGPALDALGAPETGEDEPALPGTPGFRIADIWSRLTATEKAALQPHLLGATSAEWLADLLTRHRLPISATTIRTYRRTLK
jgi:hypothetical protein